MTDPSGSAVPDARVRATAVATELATETQTNSEGLYVFPSLVPGRYNVEVSKDGFKTVKVSGTILNVSGSATQNVVLELGTVTTSVNVQAGNTLVDTDTAAISTTVDRKFAANLPLNGRSFQTLLEMTPGVTIVAATNAASQGQFVVNGQRSNSNYFTIDGVSGNIGASMNVQTHQQAAGTLPGLTASGGSNNLVSVDALEEFRILTSTFAAEFGRMPGGQVVLTTRSGTNEFHGSAYEYFRNEKLDANDWFTNQAGLSRAPLRQNNFGAVLGGPVVVPGVYNGRNKTFFFASFEGQRNRMPQFAEALTPDQSIRDRALPQIKPLLNMYPLPNRPSLAGDPVGTGRYVAAYGDPGAINATAVKINHHLSQKFSIFARYNYSPTDSAQRVFTNQHNSIYMNTHTLTGGVDYAVTPHMFNEFRGNFSNYTGTWNFEQMQIGGAGPVPTSLWPDGTDPEKVSVSLQLMGFAYGTPPNLTLGRSVGNGQRQLNFVDNLAYTTGTHTFKTGIDWRRLTPLQSTRLRSYSYAFTSVEQAATDGIASSYSVQGFAPPVHYRFDNFSWYGQDTWRATSRLTLTLGLRWELNPPPGADDGNLPYTVTGLDNPLTAVVAPKGTQLWDTAYGNFAPRLGVAYQLSRKWNTVLRGGYGLYYDLGTGQATRGYSGFPYSSYRSVTNKIVFPATGADLDAAPISLTPPFSATFYAFPGLKAPTVHQFSATIEKGFGANNLLSVSYIGAVGRKLLTQELLRNAAATSTLPAVAQLNPAYFAVGAKVQLVGNQGTSDYHSMQVQFRRRMAKGLQAQLSYTWANSIDLQSDETNTNFAASRPEYKLQRGPSDYDVRHAFSAALSYDLPTVSQSRIAKAVTGNWGVDLFGRFRTATPMSVYMSSDLLNSGITSSVRTDLVWGQPLVISDEHVPGGRRLNPAAFAQFKEARQGTLGRNAIRGLDRLRQVDLSLRRDFPIWERFRLQFRAEAFNFTNTPNFGSPSGSITNSKFGISTATMAKTLGSFSTGGASQGFAPLYQIGGPRSMQLSMRLSF